MASYEILQILLQSSPKAPKSYISIILEAVISFDLLDPDEKVLKKVLSIYFKTPSGYISSSLTYFANT